MSTDRALLAETVREAAPTLRSWLDLQRRVRRTPGVQVCVRVGGEVVFAEAFGSADLDTGEALTREHLFRVASHSKTFAATACLQLREDGKLRLDDEVATHLEEFAGHPIGALTVRELLGHQGGVVRDGAVSDYWQLDGDYPDEASLIAMLLEHGVVYDANTHFKYSNFGYSILGLIIARAGGMPFAEFVRARILDPLDLPRVHPDIDGVDEAECATGHSRRLDGDDDVFTLRHISTSSMAAATGFVACADDLSAYASAHVPGDPRLLTDASKKLMRRLETVIEVDGTEQGRYGLGFDLMSVGERRLVGHSGGFLGFVTRTWIDPDDSLVVTVLTNQSGGPAHDLALGVVKLIDLALAGAKQDAVPEGVDLDSYTGRFVSGFGYLQIAQLGGRLVAISPEIADPTHDAVELSVVDADTLTCAQRPGFGVIGEPVRLTRDADGAISSVVMAGMTSRPEADFRAHRRELMGRAPA